MTKKLGLPVLPLLHLIIDYIANAPHPVSLFAQSAL